MVRHLNLKEGEHSKLYDLFADRKDKDSRELKLGVFGFVTKRIACALTSENDNLSKVPSLEVRNNGYGGLYYKCLI